MAKKRSLSQILLIHSAALLLLMVACLGYFWVYREYLRFQDEIQSIRTHAIESQKDLIQNEVRQVIDYVRYMRSRTGERTRAALRERVYEAHSLATHIYGLYHDRIPDPEVKRLIVEALRPVRFNNGRGYYFATSLDGVSQLFADRPELENTNIVGMRDRDGKTVVRDLIAIARKKGEGFYEYTWTKPGGTGGGFPKIAFVKYFKPFDLFLGTGEYVDDMEGDLRRETLERISKITFGNDGYIFVQDMDGVFLAHPQKGLIGTSHRDFTNSYDVKIGQELLTAARYPNGGFVTYQWWKPTTGQRAPKLSYARLFDDWGWIIVTGVYIDDIERMIARRVSSHQDTIRRRLAVIGVLFVSFVALGLLIAWFFSRKVRRGIDTFTGFFRKSTLSHEKIDREAMEFSEFETLAELADRMVDDFRVNEEALRAEKDRAQMYLDTAGILFVVLDCEGRVTLVNRKGCELLGQPEAEILGREWFDAFVAPEDRPVAREAFRALLREGKGRIEYRENRVMNPNGELRLIAWHNTVVPNEGGKGAPGVLMSGDDITERRETEQRLQRSQKQLQQTQKMEAIGALAGGIAHDFNNLLGAIIGYTELYKEQVRDRPKVYGGMGQVLTAANRAKDLVQQILSFSRMAEQEKKAVALCPILKEVAKFMRASLPATIEVNLSLNATTDTVWADPTQMHQVVMNLATNAGYAMRKAGGVLAIVLNEVSIGPDDEALRPGRYLDIVVTDTGQGIQKELLERIFEPYFTTKEKGEGTGLGLSVADGIVREHGGRIKVYSEVGKGTVFHVLLPLIERLAEEERQVEEAPVTGSGESILTIDDEQSLVNMSKLILEDLGYRVTAESDPARAVALFRQDPQAFDLVITDKTMPHLTGFDVAREIRKIRPGIPIVICSGIKDQEDSDRQSEMGIVHFVTKPLTKHVLAQTVCLALGKGEPAPSSRT